jgi:hypothetical protein
MMRRTAFAVVAAAALFILLAGTVPAAAATAWKVTGHGTGIGSASAAGRVPGKYHRVALFQMHISPDTNGAGNGQGTVAWRIVCREGSTSWHHASVTDWTYSSGRIRIARRYHGCWGKIKGTAQYGLAPLDVKVSILVDV